MLTLSNTHPQELAIGVYRVLRDCLLTHSHGNGDSRRAIETQAARAGDTLAVVTHGVNGFWWGAELLTVAEINGEQRAEALQPIADFGEVNAARSATEQTYNSRLEEVRELLSEATITL